MSVASHSMSSCASASSVPLGAPHELCQRPCRSQCACLWLVPSPPPLAFLSFAVGSLGFPSFFCRLRDRHPAFRSASPVFFLSRPPSVYSVRVFFRPASSECALRFYALSRVSALLAPSFSCAFEPCWGPPFFLASACVFFAPLSRVALRSRASRVFEPC